MRSQFTALWSSYSNSHAEEIIASLRVRRDDEKSWKAVIPVRILEINGINEAYDWAVLTIKKQLTKDFTGCEADIDRIQQVMDSGRFKSEQRQAWESFGIAFGTILVNEMDGMDWVTVIDGKQEYPALRFADTEVMVYPTKLVWDSVRNVKTCNFKDEYLRIRTELEKALSKFRIKNEESTDALHDSSFFIFHSSFFILNS